MHGTRQHRPFRVPTVSLEAHKRPSLVQLCRDLGPVVYFLRTPDGSIKVGTTNGWLHGRKQARGADWTDLLVITPGSYDEERAWHERFAGSALGNELFSPDPPVMAAINTLRLSYGLPPVE